MNFLKLTIGPFLGGILMAIGLGMSGMTEPAKILGFLDIFGEWDPTLVFVMIGGIVTHAIQYRFIIKKPAPLFSSEFHVPTNRVIDKRLIVGSFIFGVGWAISGFCPAPGIVGMVSGKPYVFAFVAMMLAGMLLSRLPFFQPKS